MAPRWYRLAGLVLLLGTLAGHAQAAERRYPFHPADATARLAWQALLRQDPDLRDDARRHGFRPRRDLTALRVELDGDRRPELVLHAELISYCGSAGCMARILTWRRDRWVLACETYVEGGNGFIVDDARSAGWRNLRGTSRVTWRAAPAAPAGVTCLEGETVPRAEQGRVARGPR